MLVTQVRDGFAFNQMLAQNRDLLFRAEITSVVIVHSRLILLASTSLPSACDFPIPSEAGQGVRAKKVRNINKLAKDMSLCEASLLLE